MKKDKNLEASYCAEYMDFLAKGKTERRCYAAAVELLEKAGFKDLASAKSLKAGDRVYRGYHGKTLMACVIGRTPSAKGIRVVGGHTDAPRLDLKPRPVYEKEGVVYFDTHMYGGIKKFQWLVLPLALYGVIVKTDGTKVEVAIGDEPGDPVFMISDILPHLGKDQAEKSQKDFYPAEDLDVIASLGERSALVKLLGDKYGVSEEDLLSAELEIVPAGGPREVGLDRSLIAAYGHDDRVCAYPSVTAQLEAENSPHTLLTILADKEETGSDGVTGMQCRLIADLIEEISLALGGNPRVVRANSKCLSADVNVAYDPNFPEVFEKRNTSFINKGVVLSKYTGSRGKSGTSDAAAEFVGFVTRIFDEADVVWQMAELGKVDLGGGGTVAKFIASHNIDVIDLGVPVISMHAPYE